MTKDTVAPARGRPCPARRRRRDAQSSLTSGGDHAPPISSGSAYGAPSPVVEVVELADDGDLALSVSAHRSGQAARPVRVEPGREVVHRRRHVRNEPAPAWERARRARWKAWLWAWAKARHGQPGRPARHPLAAPAPPCCTRAMRSPSTVTSTSAMGWSSLSHARSPVLAGCHRKIIASPSGLGAGMENSCQLTSIGSCFGNVHAWMPGTPLPSGSSSVASALPRC